MTRVSLRCAKRACRFALDCSEFFLQFVGIISVPLYSFFFGFLLYCLPKVDLLFIIIKVCKLEYGTELTLNLLARCRRLAFPLVSKIDGVEDIRRLLDPRQFICQQLQRLAILPVIGHQDVAIGPILRVLPLMPPHQTLQARRLWRGPPRPEEVPDRLQSVRMHGKVDLAVQASMDIDQTHAHALGIHVVPFREGHDGTWFITSVMINPQK